ncbi:helix-turn-helix transcriptional regulator [Spirosoma sp. BT702]|uniref:Helix-turn-helix transcriptional regulator n=1 Tax=Spirosoma profusum TaxID=2771354 RepID=A0A927AT09_9BACT|nr:helix-turn-helix transcriptional regulator [Spirosoma profusum]MBD2702270.1 helix-turn-helix transcriptional regulator [Spirosoma profusum]
MNSIPTTTNPPDVRLNQRERHFIQLACSELTYVQIADKMCVSPRTVDGYREALFDRLAVRSRVGLALWAVKTGVVSL